MFMACFEMERDRERLEEARHSGPQADDKQRSLTEARGCKPSHAQPQPNSFVSESQRNSAMRSTRRFRMKKDAAIVRFGVELNL